MNGCRHFVILSVLLILSLTTITPVNNIFDTNQMPTNSFNTKNYSVVAYSEHSPIIITEDSDFSDQGWPGEGNKDQPYLIQGLNITTDGTCIEISNTSVHFKISQCYLSSTTLGMGIGVNITEVSNGTIEDSIINEKDSGIRVYSCLDCRIDSSSISSNDISGVYIRYSTNCNVTFSEITENSVYGIYIYYSSDCIFRHNSIHDNSQGIGMSTSPRCCFENNTIYENEGTGIGLGNSLDCKVLSNQILRNSGTAISCSSNSTYFNNTIVDNGKLGVFLSLSSYCNFTQNTLINNGFLIWNSGYSQWTHEFSDNLVNGKPFGYFRNHTNEVIDGNLFGEIVLFDCSNVTIVGGTFSSASIGIQIGFSESCGLTASSVTEQYFRGILVQDSINCFVSNNLFLDNEEYSIDIRSSSVNIENNQISNSLEIGLFLRDSSNCNISMNTISTNGDEGIWLDTCSNFEIVENEILSNGGDGIHVYNSNNCQLGNNSILENSKYGIYLESNSQDIDVIQNRIGWNAMSNARDDGTGNAWDNGIDTGNLWGNYNGSGLYPILGSAGSIDHFPLKADEIAPIIDVLDDVQYEEGSIDSNLAWTVFDEHPKSLFIYRNGTLLSSSSWNGSNIIHSVNCSVLGVYNYTLVLYDTCFNEAKDSVIVTIVVDLTPPVVSSPSDIYYQQGETGNEILWIISDTHLVSYTVFRNGVTIMMGLFNSTSESIIVSVEGLLEGTYNYSIVAVDSYENIGIDTVFVIVTTVPTSSPTTTTDVDNSLTGILIVTSLGVSLVIILVVFLRKRK